nr:zinc finger, CCHC-type [Tanacetum cinerariifolium]
FTSNEFTKYCKENGITRQLTAPYSPQQNGVVERRNRIVLSTTRGVEEGSKACRLYDPIAKKKHVSRDVRFMETKPWDWDKDEVDTSTQDTFWTSFVVDGVDNENTTPVNTKINDNIDPDSLIMPSAYTYSPHSDKEQDEATISSIENSENGFDHIPVREEPRNYKEASTDKKWIEAMEIELDSINKNNT